MNTAFHLDDATVVAYAGGSLSNCLSVVAASHVAMCDHCRAKVRKAEAVGAALLEASELQQMNGTWEGTLQAGMALRLVLHIRVDGDTLSGTVDSPDQGANGIPVNDLRFEDDKLSFSIKAIRATYRATLKNETLVGRWRQGGSGLKLDLNRVDTPTTVHRPQTPEPPFPYARTPVSFSGRDGAANLAGTLTVPDGDGPFTAVILVSGSGPQDRDSTIFGHKPFAVIADYFARRGVVVLRFDDRGVGASTGDRSAATIEDFAEDVHGAIALLAARADIKQIGILGHSEGALVADRTAAETERIDWIIRLAGPAVSGRAVLIAQSAALYRTGGGDEALLESLLMLNKTLYDMAASDLSTAALRSQAVSFLERARDDMAPKTRAALGLPDDVTQTVGAISTPWFRHFLRHDPKHHLAQLRVPVLALFGGKDVQVLAQQSEPVTRQLLMHAMSSTRVYANLNHLFQNAPTGSPSEYGALEETLDPAVLEDLINWIQARTAKALTLPK